MVRIPKGVILPEALLIVDAVTVQVVEGRARLQVGEIKVFPDRGGHTDPQQLATARAQAGVYEHALTLAIAALGLGGELDIASSGFLVFTWPGSNSPVVRPGRFDVPSRSGRARVPAPEEVAQAVVRDDDFSADNRALVQRVLEATPTTRSRALRSAILRHAATKPSMRMTPSFLVQR